MRAIEQIDLLAAVRMAMGENVQAEAQLMLRAGLPKKEVKDWYRKSMNRVMMERAKQKVGRYVS